MSKKARTSREPSRDLLDVKTSKRLQLYIRACANQLGLRDWTIVLNRELLQSGDSRAATCRRERYQKRVTLSFRPDFLQLDADTIRDTVIHELLHPHFDDVLDYVQHDMRDQLDEPRRMLMLDSMRRFIENGIDAVSCEIARHFPHF